MSQEMTEFNAPTSVDWDKIANSFFGFAKEKPFVALCMFTIGCTVKTHPSTKAEAIVASDYVPHFESP